MPLQLDRLSERENGLRQKGYRQLEPFFVLREGDIKDERTGGVVKLDRNRLMKIAAIQNNRITETGDFTPIVVGHTKKGKKETEQPEIVGKASRFDVVPFFETGTWGLQAVPWSKPQHVELYEKYPRRSAELWTNPDLLDPISLLGANTPRLDLGLHRLQRDDDYGEVEFYHPKHGRTGTPLYFEMDNTMPDPNTLPDHDDGSGGGGGGSNSACAAVFNSPEWKQMQQTVASMGEIVSILQPMIQEMTGGGGGAGGPGPAAPPAAGPPGPPDAGAPQQMSGHPAHHAGHHPSQLGGHPMPQHAGHPMHPAHHAGHPAHHAGHPMHVEHHVTHQPPAAHVPLPHGGHPHHAGGHPQQYDHMGGGFAAPGGMNVQTPHMQHQQAPHQMSRGTTDYDPRDQIIAELRERMAAMENQNAQLQLSMIHEHVTGVLDDLADKIVIDRDKDFNRLVRLSRADMDADVQFMLATRKPVETPLPTEAVPLHMQAGGRQAGKGPMGPVQLSLSQAHDLMEMQPDPGLGGGVQPPQPGSYEWLQEIVRNRGRSGNVDAYENARKQVMGTLNGKTPSVRG